MLPCGHLEHQIHDVPPKQESEHLVFHCRSIPTWVQEPCEHVTWAFPNPPSQTQVWKHNTWGRDESILGCPWVFLPAALKLRRLRSSLLSKAANPLFLTKQSVWRVQTMKKWDVTSSFVGQLGRGRRAGGRWQSLMLAPPLSLVDGSFNHEKLSREARLPVKSPRWQPFFYGSPCKKKKDRELGDCLETYVSQGVLQVLL